LPGDFRFQGEIHKKQAVCALPASANSYQNKSIMTAGASVGLATWPLHDLDQPLAARDSLSSRLCKKQELSFHAITSMVRRAGA
jgi:hypothetical protein